MASLPKDAEQVHDPPRPWQELYRVLLDFIPAVVFVADASGRVIDASSAFCDRTGRERAEVLSLSLSDLFPDWNLLHPAGRQDATPPGPASVPLLQRRGQATQVADFVLSTRALPDGGLVGLVHNDPLWPEAERPAASTPVHDAEAVGAEAEQRLGLLADATFEGIAVTRQGVFLDVNDQFARMVGYSREELLNTPVVRCVAPEHRDLVAGFMRSGRLEPYEHLALRKDGSVFNVEIRARGAIIGGQDVRVTAIRDVTDRKQAETARQALHHRDQEALRIARMGHWEYDIASGQFTFNDQYYSLHAMTTAEAGGYQMSAERFAREFVHPDDAHLVGDTIRAAIESNDPDFQIKIEARILRADRQPRDVTVWFRAEKDAQGRTVRLYGVNQDITERKRAEMELRVSEERFRRTFENSLAGVSLIDLEGRYLMVNPAYTSIYGYTVDEFLNTNFLSLTHPDDVELSRKAMQTVLNSPDHRVQVTKRYIHKDGHTLWGDVSVGLVHGPDGSPLYYVTHVSDITEKKLAEDALRAMRDELVTITDNTPMLIGHASNAGRFQYVNEAYARFFGVAKDSIAGQPVSELLGEKGYAVAQPFIRRALSGEPADYENILTNANGEPRTLWVHMTPHCDEAGRVIGYFILAQDITDRKRAEMLIQAQTEQLVAQNEELTAQNEELVIQGRALEQAESGLRQLNEELEARIRARSAELSAANEELTLANAALARAARMKDEFLAAMSHELRTPLTGIIGLAEVLAKGIQGPLTDKQIRSLNLIDESGHHLLDLINDILDVSKVEAGKVELELAPVDVANLCRASVQFVRQLALKKQLRLTVNRDFEVITLVADVRRLKQILVNLLSNAVKFTPEGGEVGLEVKAEADQNRVRFTVWDTGIGIAPAELDKLFKPFVQLDSRLAREYSGTGLGLSLVMGLAKLHGGGVTVESTPGQGSRFSVTLPWTPANGSLVGQDRREFRTAAPAVVRKALTVEDAASAAEQLTQYLTVLGIQNTVLAQGSDAVETAARLQPDVILLDLLLPGISGWDVLRDLKTDLRTRAVPVIIVSVVDERGRAKDLGVAEYLVKPVALSDLQRALSRALARPRVLQPASPAPVTAPGAQPTHTVLLAEDSEYVAASLVPFLEAQGYRVVVAHDGHEALSLARTLNPGLILMDIQMPGLDGLEVTRQLRAGPDAHLAEVPIIALTALAMPGDRERCLAAGATDYLTKPLRLAKLLELTRNLLGGSPASCGNRGL